MIRVYLALFLLLLSGASLYASGDSLLTPIGVVEILVALLGLHAHYTHQE